jgi:hypothetical protein
MRSPYFGVLDPALALPLSAVLLATLSLMLAEQVVGEDRGLALRTLIEELYRRERLDAAAAVVRQDIEDNNTLIVSLIEGRTTLSQVMTIFRDRDADRPVSLCHTDDHSAGDAVEERYLRMIIEVVRRYLAEDQRLPTVMGRLEAQWRDYVAVRRSLSSCPTSPFTTDSPDPDTRS